MPMPVGHFRAYKDEMKKQQAGPEISAKFGASGM